MLLSTHKSWLRQAMDKWFDDHDIRPQIVAEFDDCALMNVFGQSGLGVFPGPSAIEVEIRRQYGVNVVGRIPKVREQYFAISVERKLKHPAVLAISAAARHELFADEQTSDAPGQAEP